MIQSVIAIIPLLIPYRNVCSSCNEYYYNFLSLKRITLLGERNIFDTFIIRTLPYFMVLTLLIFLFPNTGLGRILYLPILFIMNSLFIAISLGLQNLKTERQFYITNIATIVLTIVITICFYPQE